MQTLALVQGDLALNAGTYLTFSGPDKIRQDLQLALNEAYNSDGYHPFWGSILHRYLGLPLTDELRQRVVVEVQRVLKNYIAAQSDAIVADSLADSRSRYDTFDVVRAVQSIDATLDFDRIKITLTLQTMSNQTITIKRTVIA